VTLVVYWQVGHHDFIGFDDPLYVTENRYVREGLTFEGVVWSFNFTDKEKTYWHPLTWLSHMFDYHLYGLDPGMHHRTNLILHLINTLLLFLLLRKLTGALWKSAFVAALFALHPINVDTVAWIAQRKNLLSTVFWMLTILAYVNYSKQPNLFKYLLTAAVFCLGLMTKPMLVSLPFVLLLIDYWPLGRFDFKGIPRFFHLVLEKIPFFILSALSVIMSSLSVKTFGTMASGESIPMTLRFGNALVAYIKYIGNMLWPHNLAIFYPYPQVVPLWQAIGAGAGIAGITIGVFLVIRAKPYLGVGWMWYLGTLFPVLGLVQVGLWPAMADRFAYIPFIGLFIMIAWGIPVVVPNWPYRNKVLAIISVFLLANLMASTWVQTKYWKESLTLYQHAVDVTENNDVMHYNLGVTYAERGRFAQAIRHYLKALQITPNFSQAHNNLGTVCLKLGRTNDAFRHYREALKVDPDFAEAHCNLGKILAEEGRSEEAIRHYREALRIDPDLSEAHYNLGNVLVKEGRSEDAIRNYRAALRIDPDFSKAYNNLGLILITQGKIGGAITCFKEALRVDPGFPEAQNNLQKTLDLQARIDKL
jgi:tetratricopeptide (TPR) repeat protein